MSRALGAALLALGLAVSAQADSDTSEHSEQQESELTVTGRASEPAPWEPDIGMGPEAVDLDRLLKLPSNMTFESQSRQGASEAEWRVRFRESRAEIQAAESALEQFREEMEEKTGAGGGQWQMAPPGSNSSENSPVSFKLREDIRRGKELLVEAEHSHRELEVRADLADVPIDWREGS